MLEFLMLGLLAAAVIAAVAGYVLFIRNDGPAAAAAQFERDLDAEDPAVPDLPAAHPVLTYQAAGAWPATRPLVVPDGLRLVGRQAVTRSYLLGPARRGEDREKDRGLGADRVMASGSQRTDSLHSEGRVGEFHERLPRMLTINGRDIFPTRLASERYLANFHICWGQIRSLEQAAWREYHDGFAALETRDWKAAA
jgi:hypothetical protein